MKRKLFNKKNLDNEVLLWNISNPASDSDSMRAGRLIQLFLAQTSTSPFYGKAQSDRREIVSM
jgi:hypothetical protein